MDILWHTQSAQQAFSTEFPLMLEWGESKSFDVATGSTQTMPSCHTLNFAWGEHCLRVPKSDKNNYKPTGIVATQTDMGSLH